MMVVLGTYFISIVRSAVSLRKLKVYEIDYQPLNIKHMTKDELLQFLKEKMKININRFYSEETPYIGVDIIIDNEVICHSEDIL
jgi:hypothetical protein